MLDKALKYLLITLFIGINGAFAQGSDIVIGQNYTIHSKAFNKETKLQVYLPENHKSSNKQYPVLYVLDGKHYFSNAVAIQTALRVPDVLPEMIVVGINLEWSERRNIMFYDSPEKFLSFLEEDVISFVDRSFNTSKERILFGWEASGYYASNILFHKKQLFDGVIATDGAYSDEETLKTFSDFDMPTNKRLYFANSDRDIYYVASSNEFAKLLEKTKPKNLTWKYHKLNDEVHESLPYLAMYHGLKYYYHNFHSLLYKDIATFHAKGGMKYLKEYFKQRGERFGLSTQISDAAKNDLIWLGLNRDDFKNFDYFMTEFKDVLSTKRYQSNYWQNKLGQFYLKNKSYAKAKSHFEYSIKHFSGSAEIYSGLGNVYLAKNDRKGAIFSFEKAVELSKENNDNELQKYKKQLNKVNKRKEEQRDNGVPQISPK